MKAKIIFLALIIASTVASAQTVSLYDRMVAYYESTVGSNWVDGAWALHDNGDGVVHVSGEGAPESIAAFENFEVPVKVPDAVTPRQLRLALIDAGITLQQVETAINSIEGDVVKEKALVEWEYAIKFERANQLTVSIGTAVGLTSNQIDQLFISAAEYK